jgi:LysR family hydrogen peroxide-inducible transcriptional activator
VDVIIVALPFDEPGIKTQPIYHEPFVTLLPASHPLALQGAITVEELGNETVLLLGERHCFRDQVLEACPMCAPRSDRQADLQKTLEGASLETIRMMVTSGVGVTVVPCTAAGAERYAEQLLTIRRFKDATPGRTVALAWRSSFPRPKAIEVLRQAVSGTALSCVEKIPGG